MAGEPRCLIQLSWLYLGIQLSIPYMAFYGSYYAVESASYLNTLGDGVLSMRASSIFLCLTNIGLAGFLLFAQPAYGNIYSPSFTPDPPVSGQPIIYTLSYPACPGGPAENVDGELYWVNREGQNIQVIAIMPFRPCIPIQVLPPVQFEFDMGELPPGEYTLSYYEAFENVTFPVDPNDPSDPNSPFVGLVFETEFSVLQGPRSVSALNGVGLGLLLVLLLGIASWRLLASRSSRSG